MHAALRFIRRLECRHRQNVNGTASPLLAIGLTYIYKRVFTHAV